MSSYNGTISAEDTLCGSIAAVYGKDGASAYELAVKNGFTGTEAEWLASLKGADGEKGEKGDAGPQGEKGDTGDAGADGHSPVITAVKSGKVTTIQADGTAIAEIHDGEDGESAGNAVLYTGQTLTEAQKAQARANIGAGTVNDADLTELSDAFAADLAEKQDVLTAGDNITISADGTISATGGSGGGSEWSLVLNDTIDDNPVYQPLTLDYETGAMTFETTPTCLNVVVPNFVVGDTLETAYAKIPNEFLSADQRYTSSTTNYGQVTSLVSGGVNENVDVTAFHFEYGSGISERVWNGFSATKHKGSFSTYGVKTKPYNYAPSFYMVLSDGSTILLANLYRGDGLHWLNYVLDWEATIENGILRINKSVSQWVHKARTNGTESPTVTNTSISRYAKNIGAGVMITGYKTSEITNWGNSYFFANGTNIKVWEGA